MIAAEEARAWARLEPYRARLAGKRVLLNTGGVKSWSVVSALMELGLEFVGTSVKKSTVEDKMRVQILMREEAHAFEGMAPRDLYAQLKSGGADIMLSGGRTQFIALKARVPWLDINQERIHPYAGYDGTVELVRQIDISLSNPVWDEVRTPAPWDAEGRLTDRHVSHFTVEDDSELVEPTFAARHRRKFANSRVDNTDPEYLAHHRKKFAGHAADDIGDD